MAWIWKSDWTDPENNAYENVLKDLASIVGDISTVDPGIGSSSLTSIELNLDGTATITGELGPIGVTVVVTNVR